MTLQGSADGFEPSAMRSAAPRYPGRFYLPECWSKPVSIEGPDIDELTNHALRKDASLASWQVQSLPRPAGRLGGAA